MLTAEGLQRLDRVRAITASFEAELLQRIPQQHRDHFLPALHALWDQE